MATITKPDNLLIAHFAIEVERLDRFLKMDAERSGSPVEVAELTESIQGGKRITIVEGECHHVMRVIAVLIDQGEAVLLGVRNKTPLEQQTVLHQEVSAVIHRGEQLKAERHRKVGQR